MANIAGPEAGALLVQILIATAGGLVAALTTALILVGKFNGRLLVAENQIKMIAELSSEVKELSGEVGEVKGRVGILESEQKGIRTNVHDLRNDINSIHLSALAKNS
jgi:hypothetical protein